MRFFGLNIELSEDNMIRTDAEDKLTGLTECYILPYRRK